MKKTYKFSSMLLACVTFSLISFQSIGQSSAVYENYKGIEDVEKAKAEFIKDKEASLVENAKQRYTTKINRANNSSPEIGANDNCANAIPVTCGTTVFGNTVGAASLSSNSISGCGTNAGSDGTTSGARWYSIVGDGFPTTLNTCLVNTSYDTWLTVYTGSCGSLVCDTFNDDGPPCGFGPFRSELTFPTTLGQTYYIVVSGYSSNEGDFELSIAGSCTGSPCAPLSMSFNLTGEKPQWKAAGASNDNTFYYGIAQDKNVKVKVTGGVGPFTYTWSNNQGYTTKPLGAPNARQLFEPQGPSYMVCSVLDIGTGCTSKDSVFVDWSNQFWCGVTGGTSADFWKLTICQSGVTSCVSWNAAKAAIFSSPPTATLGACIVPPKTDLVNQAANLSVYPNPSNGLFTLEMPIASNTKGNVAVTDINGRVLYTQALEMNEGTLYHTIDLGALPNGIYMVRVATENEFATERIQIIR